jgi:hypothetical protein
MDTRDAPSQSNALEMCGNELFGERDEEEMVSSLPPLARVASFLWRQGRPGMDRGMYLYCP